MTKRSAVHATFVIERTYPVAPEKVYQAFADPKMKPRWFHGPKTWGPSTFTSDFRVFGRETNRTAVNPKTGVVHTFEAVYLNIEPNERIVFSYDMYLGAQKISVSLTTVEITRAGKDTKLTFTEQGVYLDGYDDAGSREEGTKAGLENLRNFLVS
jgi:uncharacterized protein YndB with AHSA1/START domain